MCKIHTLTLMVAIAFGGVFLPLEVSADEPPDTSIEQDRNANMRSRRARRRQRRQERRQAWAEAERQRQETERERLRAQQAQAAADQAAANAEAERLRRMPPAPVIVAHQPVQVQQFAFNVNQYANGTVQIQTGFEPDPYMMRGHAAGRISSRRLGLPQGCPGFWTNQPQHVVSLPHGMRYFRVDTISRQDTTLAIVTPDGQVWCDDDGAGNRNARLEGQFPAGTYAVYVGTYQRGQRANYRIALTEIPAQGQVAVAPQPQQQTVTVTTTGPQYQQTTYQQPVQQAPSCRSELLNAGHHASNLQYCRSAEPYCAQSLLQQGHHPTNLQYCQQGLHTMCTTTLLQQGHHPTNLQYCAGVDPQCAVQLLQRGNHPTQLQHCR